MSKNLYVGNLPFGTTDEDLRQAFAQYGTVVKAQVIMDRETGRSRGFGFVEMGDGAEEAINAMNGAQFGGRTLTVNEAKPRERGLAVGVAAATAAVAADGGGGGGGRGGSRRWRRIRRRWRRWRLLIPPAIDNKCPVMAVPSGAFCLSGEW